MLSALEKKVNFGKLEKGGGRQMENVIRCIQQLQERSLAMQDDYTEEAYSGFCKTLNETRTVFCEFERKDGKLCLTQADCAYGTCPHTKTCLLMNQAIKEEE